MRMVLIPAVLVASSAIAAAQPQCPMGGIAGLDEIAAILKVPATQQSMTALTDCRGRSFDLGMILRAAIVRIERADKNATEALRLVKELKKEPSR